MNKIFKILFLTIFSVTFFSCEKDNTNNVPPPRDYTEQYQVDIDSIDEFIDTHSMIVDADYNVTFTEITDETPGTPIRNHANLKFKMILNETHGVDYKVYYIDFREGIGQRPSGVDSIHVSYRGVETIKGNQFDAAQNPVWFKTDELVAGWKHIIPLFKTGTYDTTEGPNPVNFQDYGAGVMFLPSGMGYYNVTAGSLSPYSNLVFTFKLYALRYRDHDGDKILSKDELPVDADGLYYPLSYEFDTDGDGIPDYFDIDDDDDRVLTKNEIKYTYMDGGVIKTRYYPYNGAATDDPSTPWDETKGIPRAFTGSLMPVIIPPSTTPIMLPSPGSGDFTEPTRIRRHLDPNKNVKPPFYDQY